MAHFKMLTEFLGEVLDSNCEIALLDIRKKCITAIANGHNSHREVGAPITDLALRIIKEETWKSKDYLTNYTGLTIDNVPLISSTYFIKADDCLIGMFCINIRQNDYSKAIQTYKKISVLFQSLGEQLLPEYSSHNEEPKSPQAYPEETPALTENFANNYDDMISAAVAACLPDPAFPPERLTQPEKMKIVKELNSNGFFLIKGSVLQCSKRLNCSEATIYRYLSKIK